jgi:hemerythrin-like metal-binding protein
MPSLTWNEAMSVGVPMLDADHRCLMRIINLLSDVSDAEAPAVIETVLETLLIYGEFHFAREEQVMSCYNFPGAKVHVGEHRDFVNVIADLRRRWQQRREPGMAGELLDYLTEWLSHHILIQDMAYKPYVFGSDVAQHIAVVAAPAMPAEPRGELCGAI